MKLKLNKSQMMDCVESVLNEDYPSQWNHEEFAKLRSYNARKNYCDTNLQKIGSGSGRIVYKIDDQKVLKLARNPKGVAQNIVEIESSDDYYTSSLFAEVLESDEKGLWVEMELARKVTKPIFLKINEVSFDDYCTALLVSGEHKGLPDHLVHLYDNEFASGYIDYVGNYDVPTGDLRRMSSYGLVHRDGIDQIVLVDFGLTNEVYSSYYS